MHIGKRIGAALRKLYSNSLKYLVSKCHENLNEDVKCKYEIIKSILCKWKKKQEKKSVILLVLNIVN